MPRNWLALWKGNTPHPRLSLRRSRSDRRTPAVVHSRSPRSCSACPAPDRRCHISACCRAGTTVVGIEAAVTGREDFVDVALHRPWRAHPPAGHLVDHHVGPEELVHLRRDVIATVDEGLAQVEATAVQMGQGGFVQGLVEATVGMGETLSAVEQENVFMVFRTCWNRSGDACRSRVEESGRLDRRRERKKSYGGKTDLIRTHESPEELGCASSLRPHAASPR